MYGKIIDGTFFRAPSRMSEKEALENGYKVVVLTPPPDYDSDHDATEWLEDTPEAIVRHWRIVELPPAPVEELTDAEALEILLGGGDA